MTTARVLLALGVCWILYLASVTIGLVRRLSAQIAVLTIRVTNLGDTVDALETRLRTVLDDDH